MSAAIQTSVLDVLKSAQNAADGTLNVNATITSASANLHDGSGNSITSTAGALDVNIKTPTTLPVSIATAPALVASTAVIGHVIVDTAPTTAVTGTFFQATQPVSIATAPVLVAGSALIGKVGIDQTTPGTTNGVQINAALPAGSNVIGHVIVDTAPTTAVTGTFFQATQPVSVAATLTVNEVTATTANLTNVVSSGTSVTLLALNTGRYGATFYNDSTQILYLKFGATASATSYTVQLASNGYYEIPGPRIYTGKIDGIWASANGNCRVTELSS